MPASSKKIKSAANKKLSKSSVKSVVKEYGMDHGINSYEEWSKIAKSKGYKIEPEGGDKFSDKVFAYKDGVPDPQGYYKHGAQYGYFYDLMAHKLKEDKSKLGSGSRFKDIEKKAKAEGESDPAAVAAAVGIKKYGKEKMEKMAHKNESVSPSTYKSINKIPKLTFTHFTDEIGTMYYSVSLDGSPLMASTADKNRAVDYLKIVYKKFKNSNTPVEVSEWDGDAAKSQPYKIGESKKKLKESFEDSKARFQDAVSKHDLTYDYSDDPLQHDKGSNSYHNIKTLAKSLPKDFVKKTWNDNVDKKISPDSRSQFYWKESITEDYEPQGTGDGSEDSVSDVSNVYEESADPINVPLSPDAKSRGRSLISQYNNLGSKLQRENTLSELAKILVVIAQLAEKITLENSDDWFDRHTVNRNMKELKKYVSDFERFATDADTLHQRLVALYDDMGNVLNRYFDIPTTVTESKASEYKPLLKESISGKEQAIRDIVKNNTFAATLLRGVRGERVSGALDVQTASAILTVLDSLGDANKAVYLSKPIDVMAKIAWKLVGKK